MKDQEYDVSEKYRKYLVGFKVSGNLSYLLWGTDDDGVDKILVDDKKRILLFNKINLLKNYILNKHQLVFNDNKCQNWANEFRKRTPYTTYDLDEIKEIISVKAFNPAKIKKDEASKLINFLNFIGDYAYQTNNKTIIKKLKGREMKSFFDYAYNSFFWTPVGERTVLNIDSKTFQLGIRELIRLFMKLLIYA